jgi:predicted metal-dependent hydrolase
MKRQISHKETKIQYQLNLRKGSRTIRLSVYPDGRVLVSAPKRAGIRGVESFVTSKAEWILEKLKNIENNPPKFSLKGPEKEFQQLKSKALIIAEERVRYFAAVYGLKYRKISIRNTRTRWGSCSLGGNLSFNYKIVLLPEHLRDYVIVHELCHLKEFNHGKGFWDLVGVTIPNYRENIKELKSIKPL